MKLFIPNTRTVNKWMLLGLVIVALCYLIQLAYLHLNTSRAHRIIIEHKQLADVIKSTDRNVTKIKTPIKVIIVGVYRGGTSLTGKLFDHLSEGFYWFEPLAGLFINFFKRNHLKRHPTFNGYKIDEITPDEHLVEALLDASIEALRHIYTCNVSSLPVDVLLQYFVVRNTKSTNIRHAFTACLRKDGLENVTRNLRPCLPELRRLCLDSDIRAVKTIRLSLAIIGKLMDQIPDLKVIHVVRDPRGVIQSRLSARPRSKLAFIDEVKRTCFQLVQDIHGYRAIERKYPDRIFQLRFEDFAIHPLDYAARVYSYVGLDIPEQIQNWLITNTQAKEEDGMLGQRRNASVVVMKWRNNLNSFAKRNINKLCFPVIEAFRYDVQTLV